jgi:hypothetical protein
MTVKLSELWLQYASDQKKSAIFGVSLRLIHKNKIQSIQLYFI